MRARGAHSANMQTVARGDTAGSEFEDFFKIRPKTFLARWAALAVGGSRAGGAVQHAGPSGRRGTGGSDESGARRGGSVRVGGLEFGTAEDMLLSTRYGGPRRVESGLVEEGVDLIYIPFARQVFPSRLVEPWRTATRAHLRRLAEPP